jgi:putative addiction module CopG family antidote
MNISLSPKAEDLIRRKMQAGHFRNAGEVVEEALRQMEDRDQEVGWLRECMLVAQEQYRAGLVHEDSDAFWEDLDREVEEALARGDRPSPDVCP